MIRIVSNFPLGALPRLEAHEARLLGIDLHEGLIDVADELLGPGPRVKGSGDPMCWTFFADTTCV